VEQIQMSEWEQKLRAAFKHPFDVNAAVALSDELHAFEEHGGELSRVEDNLWNGLTAAIEIQRFACSTGAKTKPTHS
jgi:hypothetical protein